MMFGGTDLFSLFNADVNRRQRRKGQDAVMPLSVSLEDLYKGKTTKVKLTRKTICTGCKGNGGKDGAVACCSECNGRGVVLVTRQFGPGMIQQTQSACRTCRGEGSMINEKDRCQKCNGKRTVDGQKVLEVNIPPGSRDNEKIIFENEGDQEPDMEPGDIILVIKSKPHEEFQRSGNDLLVRKRITLNEALCGSTTIINHLDGRKLAVKSCPGTTIKPDVLMGVQGEGMPKKSSTTRGNLYIAFTIDFPENHFLPESGFKQLEELLPKRSVETHKITENTEEVSLSDFDEQRYDRRNRREAHDDDSDEEMSGGHSSSNVQCASH